MQGVVVEAAAGARLGLGAVVAARQGPAPVVQIAVHQGPDLARQGVGGARQGARRIQIEAFRQGGGRQDQIDAGQAEIAEAGGVIQTGAQGQGGGVVQIAHQRSGDRALLALGQDGAIGGRGAVIAHDVAFGLEQGSVVLVFEVHGPALLAGDPQDIAFQIGDRATALIRAAHAGLHG
ncbi:hypothetical protein D3C80_1315120 [compost metagenome]